MFKIRVVQAFHGDCLLISYGSTAVPRHMLIDGGPNRTYDEHLRSELMDISDADGQLDLIVLSHVDDDHINGVLDLFQELAKQRRKGRPQMIRVAGLWHNSFGKTLGRRVGGGATASAETMRSIRQGSNLTSNAEYLLIPVNDKFQHTRDKLICVENAETPIPFDNLRVQIVGPTRAGLQALRKKWEEWLEKTAGTTRSVDTAVPNLSSIMLLIEADGKTVLLPGDGRADHLLQGMQQAGVLNEDGTLHVDVFKLSHHGSPRSNSAELFERITADNYLICGDGKHGNPAFQTLEWLVQAAGKQGRTFRILATNNTENLQQLVADYPPESYGYELIFLQAGENALTLDLSQ